jgi:hypothetical protein
MPCAPASRRATFKKLIASGAIGLPIPWIVTPAAIIVAYELAEYKQLLCNFDDGHRNWSDVTYTGRLTWDAKSPSIPEIGDDDYNLDLWTNPVTKIVSDQSVQNSGYGEGGMLDSPAQQEVHLEFYAGETIDEFTDKGTWWDQLRQTVDGDDKAWDATHTLLDGYYAIVTGYWGSTKCTIRTLGTRSTRCTRWRSTSTAAG